MNAQRNRGMYLRVGERRLAEIRKSRKISQAKLAKLLCVVEGTIQNYEHGRNEPNITRLYDVKRARQPRVEYICPHSQQQIACLPVVPIGKQAQIRNVVVCHLSVGRCEYGFSLNAGQWAARRCAPLPKPRISACSTFNSQKPTAVRSSCRCSSVNCLSNLPKSAFARCGLLRRRRCHTNLAENRKCGLSQRRWS
jgi:DNA-binding XRE family transcriptional regulator